MYAGYVISLYMDFIINILYENDLQKVFFSYLGKNKKKKY